MTIRLVDRACCGNERLTCYLPAVDALAIFHGGLTTENIDFDQLEVEKRDEIVEGTWHALNVASTSVENDGCSVERDDLDDARHVEACRACHEGIHARGRR